jgi:hypothetical protein
VDADTLIPFTSSRAIADTEKATTTNFSATYEGEDVRFVAERDGTKRNEAVRSLPTPTPENPEPGYYDDEELLWLVRGLPLDLGYQEWYKHVHAANGRVYTVELKVTDKKIITVPAGQFTTWEVRVRSSSITNWAWVEVDAPYRVIRARFEEVNYELRNSE